jgi:EAL domain-containing protein (putative c-di-GMP-specific phosphodiesterase class I)
LVAGAKDFLTKPIDRLEVLLRVSNLLETRALYLRVQRERAQLEQELAEQRRRERLLGEERRDRLARIDTALADDGLKMVFQPIVELEGSRVVGYEALARFSGPPHRSPDEWFAEADAVGRGPELEVLAVERAIAQFAALPGDALVSLNVSPTVARTAELEACLARLPGARTVLELTEHSRIRDYESLRICLDRFRERGVRIAVDDAGAGYAGLQHILSLEPDVIKRSTSPSSFASSTSTCRHRSRRTHQPPHGDRDSAPRRGANNARLGPEPDLAPDHRCRHVLTAHAVDDRAVVHQLDRLVERACGLDRDHAGRLDHEPAALFPGRQRPSPHKDAGPSASVYLTTPSVE